MNAACNSCSNVTYQVFSVILTAMNSGRGWHSHFFCSGRRTGASGENVSPPTTGLRKRQQWSGVSVGKPFFFPIFFGTRRLQVLQGMSVKSLHANIHICNAQSWSNTETKQPAGTQGTHVFCTKDQMSTPFLGDRSWLFAHVFYESLPSCWRLFFLTGIFGSFKTPKTYKNEIKKHVWRFKEPRRTFFFCVFAEYLNIFLFLFLWAEAILILV